MARSESREALRRLVNACTPAGLIDGRPYTTQAPAREIVEECRRVLATDGEQGVKWRSWEESAPDGHEEGLILYQDDGGDQAVWVLEWLPGPDCWMGPGIGAGIPVSGWWMPLPTAPEEEPHE